MLIFKLCCEHRLVRLWCAEVKCSKIVLSTVHGSHLYQQSDALRQSKELCIMLYGAKNYLCCAFKEKNTPGGKCEAKAEVAHRQGGPCLHLQIREQARLSRSV